jgi:hypothetical protein
MQRHYWKYVGAVHDPVSAALKRGAARVAVQMLEERRSHALGAGA